MRFIKLKVEVHKDGGVEHKELLLLDIEAKAELLMNRRGFGVQVEGDRGSS